MYLKQALRVSIVKVPKPRDFFMTPPAKPRTLIREILEGSGFRV